jgi:hypothetical protein
MTVSAHTTRTVEAPKEAVWAVLDDFPRISSWSEGIKSSYTTGDEQIETGLGAERRCELGGNKVLDERISAYTPGESMTVHVWNVEGLPLSSSTATFSVRSTGPGTSEVSIDAEATPKLPGFLVAILRPLLSKGIAKNFAGLLDELATQVERNVATA